MRRPPVLQQPGRHTLRDWWRWRKGREWRREELTILVSLVLRVRGKVMGVSRIWMLLRHCYAGFKNRKSFRRYSRLCLCCYEVRVVEVIRGYTLTSFYTRRLGDMCKISMCPSSIRCSLASFQKSDRVRSTVVPRPLLWGLAIELSLKMSWISFKDRIFQLC